MGQTMKLLGDNFFARAMLAGDQHVRIRRTNACDELKHRLHLWRLGDERRHPLSAQETILCLESLAMSNGAAEFYLSAENAQKSAIFPGLLYEVACATSHGFDSNFDAAPRGHDNYGKSAVHGLNAREKIESFFARGSVTSVIQIDEQDVEILQLDRIQHRGRISHSFSTVSLTLQKHAQGFANVWLIVGDEDLCASLTRGDGVRWFNGFSSNHFFSL